MATMFGARAAHATARLQSVCAKPLAKEQLGTGVGFIQPPLTAGESSTMEVHPRVDRKSNPIKIIAGRGESIQACATEENPSTPWSPPYGDKQDTCQLDQLRNRHARFYAHDLGHPALHDMHFNPWAVGSQVP
jgi:hypothetical protein